jgi:hypothetical protein
MSRPLLVILDPNIDFKTLARCNQENTQIASWAKERLKVPFDVGAHDFLRFGRSDFRTGSLRGRVNALSNAKRAIDCQIDSLLFAFGLLSLSRRQHWNFPAKMKTLKHIGVVTPEILRKIVRRRNVLEHEYHSPGNDEVEDALDIAELFIKYTDDFLRYEWLRCEFEAFHLYVTLRIREEKIVFEKSHPSQDRYILIGSINAASEQYLDYLKWFLPFVRHLT